MTNVSSMTKIWISYIWENLIMVLLLLMVWFQLR